MPELGFNCRAERDKWRAGGIVETPPVLADVGPGSYDIGGGVSSCEAKPGYAPFLSTAERKFGPSIAANLPGPGDYSTEPCPTKAQSGKPSDVFRSATRRFQVQQPISETPGPGAYGGHEEFRDKGRSMSGNPKGNTDRIKWVRVPTAPSIPGREQSYGYEEGNQGELIMQRPADLGHSGKGDDRPGPVDYQPRIEFTRRSPAAIDFSKGEDRLVALSKTRASTTPGPGHYNATGGLGASDEGIDVGRAIYRKRQRPTASFHYGCKRDRPQKCKESLPGPGDYVVPSGLDVRRDPGRKDLSFLSTSRRFDELATHGNGGSRAPGPGSYVTAPSDFDRWRTLYRARQPPRPSSLNAPIGFQSTTLRFAGDLPKDQGLGPAAYNPGGMAEELSQKGSGKGGKSGAFGSTARRFPVKGSGQQNLPGPGSYELAVGPGGVAGDGDGRSRSGPSAVLGPAGKRLPSALSCFASGSKRFSQPSSAKPGPAPGQYEVRQTERPRGIPAIGKQSKNRFEELKTFLPPGLGPGSYNVKDIEQLGRVRSRKNIMISSQERFKDSMPKADVPGPGHYGSGLGYGTMLKQTYNIVIAEQSAGIF